MTGKPVEKRLAGNLAIALSAVEHGAAILRVHEVGETLGCIEGLAGDTIVLLKIGKKETSIFWNGWCTGRSWKMHRLRPILL